MDSLSHSRGKIGQISNWMTKEYQGFMNYF